MENDILVGLDIGTTKVCAVVAKIDEQENINILGVGLSPSDGLTRGVVTNIEKTVRSINSAVAEAESRSGIKIQSVVVGIAGEHIQSFQSRGVIAISNSENDITKIDVDRLIEDTKRVALPADRKIIHVIPQEFIIDGQDGVKDPVGMSGVRLEANVHIITGLISAAQNIYKCFQLFSSR
jgi:cell division protein FtsA